MAIKHAFGTGRADNLSPFWKALAGAPSRDTEPESPEQLLRRLGLSNFEQVPQTTNWRNLISRNARSSEEIAIEVAKIIRMLLLGLTRVEWDTLMGISEAERNEPAMVRKHDAVKARLARFVERWDPPPLARAAERYAEVQRRIDAYLEDARDSRQESPPLQP